MDPVDNNAAVLDERWLAFRKTARQLLVHTGAEDAPFATCGTYFLVTYEDRLFAVTARRGVGDNPPEKRLLIVSDKTVIPARVLEQIDPSDEIGGGGASKRSRMSGAFELKISKAPFDRPIVEIRQ